MNISAISREKPKMGVGKLSAQSLSRALDRQKHQNRIQLNHIRRLEEANKELAEVVAVERGLRKKAYSYYQEKLNSKLWPIWGFILMERFND